MDIKNLVPVDYSNQRVLLTAQVAEVFNTTTNVIKENFRYAKEQFEEGVHFFKVSGIELRALKKKYPLWIDKFSNSIMLWTAAGIFLHCKMLNTKPAWDLFTKAAAALNNLDGLNEIIFNHIAPPESKTDRACVYAMDFSKFVKIGSSNNLQERQTALCRELQLEIFRLYHTAFFARQSALSIEKACHKTFQSRLAYNREYFNISFEEACNEINRQIRQHRLPLD